MATVLIVDDDESIGTALGEELKEEGFSALYVSSADAALDVILSRLIDLVLLDLKMPGKDGFYVLRKLRELKPGMRVIVLSAYADVESAMEVAQLGASDFFQKPFDFTELITTIKKLTTPE
jgi:DNA-binding response OmpR family regulator